MKNKIIISILAIILILLIFISYYLCTYYHSETVVCSYMQTTDNVAVTEIKNGYFFDGKGEKDALIFYPGAKVEETAYSKLMYELADNGVDCFLLKVPFKIAFFGMNYADNIINNYEYENWYLAGHSLGGVVASMYVDNTQNNIKDLVYLASYPTKKINDNIKIISIYGENDGVLDLESYNNSKYCWSVNNTEHVIKGGNHAGFANYGIQSGDKSAKITRDDQIDQTVKFILENLK